MRRVRILVLAVILIAIVCAGISLYAYQHNKRAEENTIDIIKDFTGKEEVDVSGQSRKPIDSMTLYDGGVLEIYTETQFKGKDTLNIPAKYEKKKVKTVQILSQLEQTSYYLKHIVLEDGIEELEFQGCPNLETVVFPPSIKKIDTRHFKNLKKQITIYVTKDSYAEKWAKKHHFSYRCIGNKNKPPAMQVCSQTALASSKKPPCYNEYKVRQPNHYNKEESKWTIIVYHTQNGHANII